MKNIKYLILFSVLFLLSACSNFLEEMPDDRTVIDSNEKIGELLVGAYPEASYIPFLEAMSDNAGDKSPLAPIQTLINQQAYKWEIIEENQQDTPNYYWQATYQAIAASNHALEAIELRGNLEEDLPYKGEALLARAYSHFMLVSLFSQRYNPNRSYYDKGIPYIEKPEKVVFGEYKRGTVEEVYQKVQRDLEAGLDLINDKVYSVPKYHFTRVAAFTFASRFYLHIGAWNKAVEYSSRVIGSKPAHLLRDWEQYTSMDYNGIETAYTKYDEPANLLLSEAISNWGRYAGLNRFGMTVDIRDEIFPTTNVAGDQMLFKIYGSETSLNIPKYKEYFKFTSINASTGIPYIMAPLFTAEEALFNRAEAYIMLEQYDLAIDDINAYLSKRIANYTQAGNAVSETDFQTYYEYYPPSLNPYYEINLKQTAFIKGILDLKRKEYVQEGNRWFDIKRFNIEISRKDDNGNKIDILKRDDLRRAIQIPQSAQAAGIEANPR
ncbi:MAG: RagB/SusD family nutrient uptake outer membrane protein [Bacteroidales bacterium]